ncbi:ribonuclease YeeF family protein [Bacillus nakamurai]|uniref:ribonuclease YeeF family protein n=1 Tax=Bacillus nakamurai TaxID=1793963 RepID=UPI0020C24A8A|nr:T7SS effector LXG polymorphic toxin [Bacillus nakamurai]MCP6683698.1 T7SS effector LXG polymorphic toxin [Bacillus nakamurai]
MSKVFEAHSLIDESAKRKEQYEALEEQLNTLKQAFQGIADLGDDFKGKGADNIKDFFQGQAEIAESWLTLVSSQIAFLKGISGEIKDRKLNDSYAETSFLEHEAANGEAKASEMMSAQKAEADSILSGIRDIIALEPYSLDDFTDDMSKAQNVRLDTVKAIEELDHSLTAEYQNIEALDHAVLNKYSVLMQATSNGKSASPMYFDKKAFHSNEIYKGAIEVEKQGAAYIEAKAQQAEARRLKEKQEAEANKPWYEKTWDGICTFTGEISGYYDYKRAAEGIDPVTGETLSAAERITAGAMAAAGFIPVVGWAGRAFKGGKAIYKTGKTVIAAEHALDAYKIGKSMDILKMTEMGAYGLAASNGFTEAVTGRDMFGNQVSEEKRKQGALEAALNLVGAGALARHARKGIPLSTPPKIQKANNILEQVKQFKVPTNVRVYAEQPVTANGFPIGLPRVRADVKKTAVKDLGIVKMVGGKTPDFSKLHDYVAHNNYYSSKEFRKMIKNAEYFDHGKKHIKAKTDEQAKLFSETGKKQAQYLATVDNRVLEKTVLEKGRIVDEKKGTIYFFHRFEQPVGYDLGKPANWVRAELTSGGKYHGHPMNDDRIKNYLNKMMSREEYIQSRK